MMFDTEHFNRCKAKSDNPDVINIVHVISEPTGLLCMACGKEPVICIRRIEEPIELNAHVCDSCMLLPARIVHEMCMNRFTRRVDK